MQLIVVCFSAALALASAQQYGNQQYRQQPKSYQALQYNSPQPQQYTAPKAQQYNSPQPQQYNDRNTQQYNTPKVKQYNSGADKAAVPILAYSNAVSPDGSYSYSYQTGDGSSVQESGYSRSISATEEANTVQGSYSYIAPDGTQITVTYVADENGFRAEGAHLPTPPPIPEAIQRSLELIAASQRQDATPNQRQQSNSQRQQQRRYN